MLVSGGDVYSTSALQVDVPIVNPVLAKLFGLIRAGFSYLPGLVRMTSANAY